MTGGSIENCCNRATIEASFGGWAGGIVGVATNSSNPVIAKSCSNEGQIVGMEGSRGGICGSINGKVDKCYNSVDLPNATAGIGNASEIVNCYNLGNIGDENTGNAAGIGSAPKIANCYSKGEITANPSKIKQYGGPAGICVSPQVRNIYNCCSNGDLHLIGNTGTYDRSGAVSRNSTLTNCYYLSRIEKDTKIIPEASATPFLIEATEQVPTTSDMVVSALNKYIDDNKTNEDENLNTSEWLKWRKGADGLPELIIK